MRKKMPLGRKIMQLTRDCRQLSMDLDLARRTMYISVLVDSIPEESFGSCPLIRPLPRAMPYAHPKQGQSVSV
jgi:hypothetical protein